MPLVANKMNKFLQFGILLCASVLVSQSVYADWKYVENTDPMTDENKSIAMTSHGRNESVIVRCDGNSDYDIILSVGEYLNDNARVPVQFRIDDKEPSEERSWSLSTDGTAVFAPLRYKKELIEGLKNGSQIVVQITDYRGSKPFSKFSLAGSSAAISQLTCLSN
ncbi:hypothetical protein RE428_25140 [Marinobacter nanhaiticus D15-8W]|uniref:Uncharacterized protein n=1 Tax=Marinobacter nanhaiticus D15-8W TaxID=626887 RepID=N6W1Y9_9GAMM|nr:invasion associated locus B family protein [Marinobacter nanhaiticus]ENO14114.1 hypothetical protein J057_22010 [Marinobacter nanhaiticus D15-8W]BES71496.1 hypothetical protein RE428_25140 [Marinobacter nanhaiticus D15-8W]